MLVAMSARRRSAASPGLPFDERGSTSDASAPQRTPPTVFISYTHESPDHNARVLRLAQRLETEGVSCELDVFESCPPEGWPAWMFRQVGTKDYCIVVCTESYRRRLEGTEAPGKGKGATWEGRAVLQRLYDTQSYDWLLPVVFDPNDLPQIPLALRSATYYVLGQDLGTGDDYAALYCALTKQPVVYHPPAGPLQEYLPQLPADEAQIVALLGACPDPTPAAVIAPFTGHPSDRVEAMLRGLGHRGLLLCERGLLRLRDPAIRGLPSLLDKSTEAALGAILDYIRSSARDEARAQVMNAVSLARAVSRSRSINVSRTFRVLQAHLKAFGNKRLLLDVARRSIAAARAFARPSAVRETARVEDEAIAAVCGVSWVYQRTGRLPEAFLEAQHSLDLGQAIHWHLNTAFCHKCMGRLRRLNAEDVPERGRRAELLADSVNLLRRAISEFAALERQLEVGDCYSLLARTHLAAGDLGAAGEAVREADTRLVEPGTKDYIDFQMVKGDLLGHYDPSAARALYTDILTERDSDAQKSEIFARAHLQRGRLWAQLGNQKNAITDFRSAASIWDHVEDPTADFAHWEIERTGAWMDEPTARLLGAQPVGVRVRAARMIKEGMAGRGVARSQRAALPTAGRALAYSMLP